MRNRDHEDTQRRVLRHNLQRLTQQQLIEQLIDTKLALRALEIANAKRDS